MGSICFFRDFLSLSQFCESISSVLAVLFHCKGNNSFYLFSSARLLPSPSVFLPLRHCQTAIISRIKRDSIGRNKDCEWGRPVTFHPLRVSSVSFFVFCFFSVRTDMSTHAVNKPALYCICMRRYTNRKQERVWRFECVCLFSFFILHPPPSLSMTVSASPPLIMRSLSIDRATYSVAECQATIQLYYCNWCVETLSCSMSTHSAVWLVHWLAGWLLHNNWWKQCQGP